MKHNGRSMSMPVGIGLGIGISLLVTVFGGLILSWLVAAERIEEQAIGYGAMVILAAGAALGCLTAWGKIRHRRLMITGICGVGYFVSLLIIGLLFGGVREGLVPAAAMIGVGGGISLIPALVGSRSGGRKPRFAHFR